MNRKSDNGLRSGPEKEKYKKKNPAPRTPTTSHAPRWAPFRCVPPRPLLQVMGFLDMSVTSSPEVSLSASSLAAKPSDGGACACSGSSTVGNKKEGRGRRGGEGEGRVVDINGVFVSKHVSALQTVEGFLDALTNTNRYSPLHRQTDK